MRAVLILVVLATWAACIVGAVGFTTYLAVVTVRWLRGGGPDGRTASPPPRGIVVACATFAAVMVMVGAALAGSVLWAPTPGSLSSALAWAALPAWAAATAALSAVILGRRRQTLSVLTASS